MHERRLLLAHLNLNVPDGMPIERARLVVVMAVRTLAGEWARRACDDPAAMSWADSVAEVQRVLEDQRDAAVAAAAYLHPAESIHDL